jgi:Na+-translocating ferredoxin:NAD+ oxidoreductase RnfC subunit
VCPSAIPLTARFRAARARHRQHEEQRRRATEARARYDRHQQRIAAEAERERQAFEDARRRARDGAERSEPRSDASSGPDRD